MKLHAKIYLDRNVNLNALWDKIFSYHGTHLSGENSHYVVLFDGDVNDGLTVLRECLNACEHGKFYADFGA